MNRSRRFFGGLRFSYLYQAVAMLGALWLTPFLLRHLGQHDYGLWLVGLQTLNYLMLMDFGVVALLPRETAYATGHAIKGTGSNEDLAELIGRTARIVLYQTPFVILGALAVWHFVPMGQAIRGPILVAMLGFGLLFPLRIFQAVLHGLQETAYLSKLLFVSWGVSTAVIVALIWLGMGLYALGIGWVAGQLAPSVLSFYRLKSAFPGVLPSRLPKIARQELFQSMTAGGWVSIAQIAQVLVGGTDYVIIGKLLGASAVVPYACTQKLVMVLANQPHMIMEMAAPGLSQMKTSESLDRIFRVCNTLALGMLTASGAVVCVVLAVNHSFVSWWLGEQQFAGALVTLAFVVSLLLRQWNTTVVFTIFALGHQRRISMTTLGDGAVTLVCGVVLVHWLGPIGAAIGSILGVCIVSLPGNISALAKDLQVSMFAVITSVWPWFWRFLLVATGAGFFGLRWHANLPYVVGATCLTGLVYALVMVPMVMDSNLKNYLPSQVTQFWDSLCRRFSWSSASVAPVEVSKNS